MSTLVELIGRARDAGLAIGRDGDKLTIRGDRQHGALVRQILARKTEALTVVDVYNGAVPVLDWRHATVADKPGRCLLCKHWALLRDPYDDRPMHKTCAEVHIQPRPAEGSAAA